LQHFSDVERLAVQRAAVRAWPAGETQDIDGWLWRYSGGASQRANSVSTLDFLGDDVGRSIERAEKRYLDRASTLRFQFGNGSTPVGLDDELLRRGYKHVETVTTLARRLDVSSHKPKGEVDTDDVDITSSATDDWLAVYLAGISDDRRSAAPRILARVPQTRGFVIVRRRGKPIATALGVITGDIAIVECVMTAADARRTGAAGSVMRGLEAWALSKGTQTSALQAVLTNAPAQALYAGLGYVEIGRQHYFVLDR
jgi:N-acetylglutamate synthase